MLESKDHWQISNSSGALDLTFAFRTRGQLGSECYTAASSNAALPGKRFSSAVTMVFIFEPNEPLIMMASPARTEAITCASRFAAPSAYPPRLPVERASHRLRISGPQQYTRSI